MKKLILLLIILNLFQNTTNAQCTCNYSFIGTTDTLMFTNLSVVSNAHYFWNFGDGQTDYATSPVHVFPESGKYLVTLYGRDTISGCHTYFESWITVNKPSLDPCQPLIGDTIINYLGDDYLVIYDSSSNCLGYYTNADAGCAWNFPFGNYIGIYGWPNSLFLTKAKYNDSDSITGYINKREYFKTRPYLFSSNLNYDDCSSNFEFSVHYQSNGAMVYLTAMNQTGLDTFSLIGFGNPIPLVGHSVSHLYPILPYNRDFTWIISHSNYNPSSGCRVVSNQVILIRNPNYNPPNCGFPAPPQNVSVNTGSNAQFYISSSPTTHKQWQQDAGLGFQNLSNAGFYSGVHTDTLTVSNVWGFMNNYHYKCIVEDTTGVSGCHNTSAYAVLTVLPLGVDDINDNNTITIFPNPFTEQTTISFSAEQKNTTVRITDIVGKEIKTINFTGRQLVIEKEKMKAGIYFVQTADEQKRICNRKIVIE